MSKSREWWFAHTFWVFRIKYLLSVCKAEQIAWAAATGTYAPLEDFE